MEMKEFRSGFVAMRQARELRNRGEKGDIEVEPVIFGKGRYFVIRRLLEEKIAYWGSKDGGQTFEFG